jgi:hypothetical protein
MLNLPPPSEQPRLRASHVYLDASVYRALQFDWGGRSLSGLTDLARRGLVRVLVTEITLREVKSLMDEMWSEANKSMQRVAVVLGQLGLGDAVSAVADGATCVAKMQEAFEKWLLRCNVLTCKCEANLSAIMDDYFAARPPFGSGKKKAEFPDAIVASMLRAWCAATEQSVYVVSIDGDLKACCAPEGPLIHAASVAEVVSHGTASAAVHDAVTAAIQESNWLFQTIQAEVTVLDVEVEEEPGYEVEVESVKLEDISIDEVFVLDFDGTDMTCSAGLTGEFALRARIEQEPMQYSERDWDPGYRHTQWINVPADLTAIFTASIAQGGSLVFANAQLNEPRIHVPWRAVERAIDAPTRHDPVRAARRYYERQSRLNRGWGYNLEAGQADPVDASPDDLGDGPARQAPTGL